MSTETQPKGPAVDLGTSVELLDGSSALEAVDRASIDVQVATAKKYPRSVDQALKEALTLATLDEQTAGSCFYVLPRGGKKIEGPSARLAEIMAYSWGNLRVDADIVAEDHSHVTAMGTCFDLEKNVAVRVRVKRRITDKHGKRFKEDMIGVTCNAAISIALRNAVFKVVPAALVNRVYAEARNASVGKGGTVTQKRQNALEWFTKLGVTEAQVFEVLGVRGVDDIGVDELVTLRGLRTAIKDGETSVEQAFRPASDPGAATAMGEALSTAAGAEGVEEPRSEEDDGSPPTASQIEQLKHLRTKARESDLLTSDDEAEIVAALAHEDGPAIRNWARKLSRMLVDVQTSLLED